MFSHLWGHPHGRIWDRQRAREKEKRENTLHQNIAARALATYLIPGCVGRGVRLGSEGSSVGGGGGVGGGGVWKFGVQKMEKIKILKIRIRSAQNVGKVWISRKKILPALFWAI